MGVDISIYCNTIMIHKAMILGTFKNDNGHDYVNDNIIDNILDYNYDNRNYNIVMPIIKSVVILVGNPLQAVKSAQALVVKGILITLYTLSHHKLIPTLPEPKLVWFILYLH